MQNPNHLDPSLNSHPSRTLLVALVTSLLTSVYLLYRLAITNAVPTAQAQAADSIPTGTVVAFNLSSCPTGWSEYTAARARTIIGTNPSAGGGLSARTLGQTGGAETHTLTINEMPAHSHAGGATSDPPGVAGATFNTSAAMTGSGWGALAAPSGTRWAPGGIGNTGGGAAHNNMPPFIVLLYCRKN